jgi:hypothetical protein
MVKFPQIEQEFKGLQSVKTHDLEVLLRFSGVGDRVRAKHPVECSVVLLWNPDKRYQAIGVSTFTAVMVKCVRDSWRFYDRNQRSPQGMHEIADRKGNFTLFALFMRADSPFARSDDPGAWDLVVSAPWLA